MPTCHEDRVPGCGYIELEQTKHMDTISFKPRTYQPTLPPPIAMIESYGKSPLPRHR